MDIIYGGGEFGGDLYTGIDAQNLFNRLKSSSENQQDPSKNKETNQKQGETEIVEKKDGPNYWTAKVLPIAGTASASDGPLLFGEAVGASLLTVAVLHDATVKAIDLFSKEGGVRDSWPGEFGQKPNPKEVDWSKSDSQLAQDATKSETASKQALNKAKKWFRNKRPGGKGSSGGNPTGKKR